jgi:hypothetical protein
VSISGVRSRTNGVQDVFRGGNAAPAESPKNARRLSPIAVALFAIVSHYKTRRKTNKLLRHAFKFANLPFDRAADPFTAVIRCTYDNTVDSKTISKWARALRYVARSKAPGTRLKTFMKEAGGVNACADQYARYFGRRGR